MTPATPVMLALYRDRHKIDPTNWGPSIKVCSHDLIVVYQIRDGRWRHDPGEVARLAKMEREA